MSTPTRSVWCELWDYPIKQGVFALIVISASYELGPGIANYLANMPKVELFKLLNLFGLLCDCIGAILLSSLLPRHKVVHKFIIGPFYLCALGFLIIFPLSLVTTSLTLFSHHVMPGANLTSILVFSAFLIVSGLFVEYRVIAPQWKGRSARYKTTQLGTYFLALGLLAQFIAAYLDLLS